MQLLKTEKKAAGSLALVYAMRMMGLFMVLPVFTLYADQYHEVTPLLMGLAIGVYGLTQGLLQIPFGMMSDKIGRKKVIVFGLLLFFAGSIVAALSESIYTIILGRALQGMGAIASVVMALAADLSREEIRMRIMASIGMSIGVAFMLSMIIGPSIAAIFGLSGIFWLNAIFALLGIVVILTITPTPEESKFQRDTQLDLSALKSILSNVELLKLNVGVMILHLVLAATFVVFPLILRDQLNVPVEDHWKTYLSVFAVSIFAMVPFIIAAEKHQKMKQMMFLGVSILFVSMAGMIFVNSFYTIVFMLFLFFTGFNFLESVLPSLISKLSPAGNKGTAMGAFSTFQFLGAFIGGVSGGAIYGAYDFSYVYTFAALLFALWLMVIFTMKKPKPLSSKSIKIPETYMQSSSAFKQLLLTIKGVDEVSVFLEDKVAYLKINKKELDEQGLNKIISL